jgi:hypothetical protein
MKYTILYQFASSYNDGAGNTARYYFASKQLVVTRFTKDIWKPLLVNFNFPKAAITITANGRGSVVGAPPASDTRTLTVGPTGLWSFVDAFEVFLYTRVTITLSEVVDHPYELTHATVLHDGMKIDLISSTAGGLAPLVDVTNVVGNEPTSVEVGEVILKDNGDLLEIFCYPTTVRTTAKQLSLITVILGEHNLMTRDYDSRMINGGMRLLVSGLQVGSKHFEGIVSQLADYFRNGNAMIECRIPTSTHSMPMEVA